LKYNKLNFGVSQCGVVFGIGNSHKIDTLELAKDVVEGGAILIFGEIFVRSNLSAIHRLEIM